MARGFDSKSVTDQQDEAERRREETSREKTAVSPRLRNLQLARVDIVRRIEAAPESRRTELRATLQALDDMIAKAEPASSG